jgi:predicted ATPase
LTVLGLQPDRLVTAGFVPGRVRHPEAESAMSFPSCLTARPHRPYRRRGSQVICATHSPLLAALPGAQILDIGEHRIREVA